MNISSKISSISTQLSSRYDNFNPSNRSSTHLKELFSQFICSIEKSLRSEWVNNQVSGVFFNHARLFFSFLLLPALSYVYFSVLFSHSSYQIEFTLRFLHQLYFPAFALPLVYHCIKNTVQWTVEIETTNRFSNRSIIFAIQFTTLFFCNNIYFFFCSNTKKWNLITELEKY